MASSRHALLFVVLLGFATGCASTEAQQSTGEYIDDAVLTTKIKAALLRDEEVEGMDVKVETFRGRVQLAGFVESREDVRRAERIAREIAGVKSVRNDLTLKKNN